MAQVERCDGAAPVVTPCASHSFIIDPSASHIEGMRDENIPTSAPVYVSEPQPYESVIAPETHVAAQPAEASSSAEAFIKNIEELFCDLESQPPGILGWCISFSFFFADYAFSVDFCLSASDFSFSSDLGFTCWFLFIPAFCLFFFC